VLTFPTPELPQTSTLPYSPTGDMSCNTMPKTSTMSALVGEHAQQGARSLGIDRIIDGLGVMHAHNSGTDYPFLEDEATVSEGYSSRFSLAVVRVKQKVASLFSIGLRREMQGDGMEVSDLAREHSGLRRADGSFGLGRRTRTIRRWFNKVSASSSTRVATGHFTGFAGSNAKGNGIANR
jgi:hypothetical protein